MGAHHGCHEAGIPTGFCAAVESRGLVRNKTFLLFSNSEPFKRNSGKGKGESLHNGYRVSVWGDENSGDRCTQL
jgi:hypothetical protein